MENNINHIKAYTSIHTPSWSVSVPKGSHCSWFLCVLLETLHERASVYVYIY